MGETLMLQIKDQIISLDILEKEFVCDIGRCKGWCCVEGDSGAPLEDEETEILFNNYEKIKPYLRQEGKDSIEKEGTWMIDNDGDKVTPLINQNECAYTIFENGIAKCGIEKAFLEQKISFQKPISCHLYPIRVTKYKDFEALNYDTWDICKVAVELGKTTGIPIYKFLKLALIRKYGKDWYEELEITAENLKNK